jgi:hypothetical protein
MIGKGSRFKFLRRCSECGEPGHAWMSCPQRIEAAERSKAAAARLLEEVGLTRQQVEAIRTENA